MVIIQLTGGLGNQLFQYAMGLRIATLRNTELKLDLSFFADYAWHEYSLAPFSIEAPIATPQEVNKLTGKNRGFLERMSRKLFHTGTDAIIVQEKNLLFDESYLSAPNNSYLQGYWQCERYFMPVAEQVRKAFSIKLPPSPPNAELLAHIAAQDVPVSLHIRRGNFVNVDFVNKVHGTTKLDYYHAAIEMVAAHFPKPVFYIFSDDMEWAKAHLHLEHEHRFVDVNDDKTDYEDLRLMSACRHHILANSTFSWWGAWLNAHPDKMVIAPKEWFADEAKNRESATIVPTNWTRL